MKKILILILAVVIVFGAGLAFSHWRFYLLRAGGGGGELVWRNGEAYLFMIDRPFGYHLSASELLAEPVSEYFNAPTIPDNDSYALTTIHVTLTGVDQHVQKATVGISDFTPIGDGVYAVCPGGICKWSGAQFELITTEAQQKMGGRNRLVSDWKEFTDDNGWSKRPIRAEGPGGTPVRGEYSIEVGKECVLLVTEGNPTSVDLQRTNKSKERLWYYKQGLSVVRKGRYKTVFGLD